MEKLSLTTLTLQQTRAFQNSRQEPKFFCNCI